MGPFFLQTAPVNGAEGGGTQERTLLGILADRVTVEGYLRHSAGHSAGSPGFALASFLTLRV